MVKSNKSKGSPDVPKPRFCYACKTTVVSTEKDFRAAGHVDERDIALKKYQVRTNRLHKNVTTRV